jgi:transmembrane 9 superfamily protein 2/4
MKGMALNYQQHWIIDNMPVTLCYTSADNKEVCSRGFPIGCYVTKRGQSKESCNIRNGKNDTFYVFNHLDFEISYHSGQGNRGIYFHSMENVFLCCKEKLGERHSEKMVVE